MALTLRGGDARLSGLCRELEARAGEIVRKEVTIQIVVLNDFDDPTVLGLSADMHPRILMRYQRTPAMYRASTSTVYVNARAFFAYEREVQGGILAHELGHGIPHQEGRPWRDEVEADLMACRLGFRDGIAKDRAVDDPKWAEAFALWPNEDETRQALHVRYMQRLAGID